MQVHLEGDRNVTGLVGTYNLGLIISLGTSLNYDAIKAFAITKMEEQIFVESIYQKLGLKEK